MWLGAPARAWRHPPSRGFRSLHHRYSLRKWQNKEKIKGERKQDSSCRIHDATCHTNQRALADGGLQSIRRDPRYGLRDALESWGLQECHLVCVTTDNATNNISAMELNEWERLQCFGHRLQLAIENALKVLTPASTKQAVERAVGVKKVVSAFSNSWKRKRDLAKAQAVLGLPPHQLITETPTRWGSRQQIIERFLEQEKALSQVLLADKETWTLDITH
ncbi:zinc finger BED domain-containing protein 4-like isoform X2 [Brienomyrus brachyistius]|uniref:zinc finger BED domain-containing protein 4-like isoform X2 n=1 Tax=Brienomyrus brachyistius TaxID=42636 RepID=UPI0020B416EC|nr:zinc finger BED domain-containing protein 4-like isoform X2 [Brienomyrus brachyistius]